MGGTGPASGGGQTAAIGRRSNKTESFHMKSIIAAGVLVVSGMAFAAEPAVGEETKPATEKVAAKKSKKAVKETEAAVAPAAGSEAKPADAKPEMKK
jgi:hypothetical protein